MSGYLLDTTLFTAYLQGADSVVHLVDPWLDTSAAATSILVYGETIEYLASKSGFARRHEQLRELMQAIRPHYLTYGIMERYADLRLRMRRPYGPGLIGDVDTLIAATALERRLTLVTTDGDFHRVPDLPVLVLDRTTLRVRQS